MVKTEDRGTNNEDRIYKIYAGARLPTSKKYRSAYPAPTLTLPQPGEGNITNHLIDEWIAPSLIGEGDGGGVNGEFIIFGRKSILMVKLRGRESYPIYFGASADLLNKAHDLRSMPTRAEKLLWAHIRKRKLDGFKFRRQHPIHIFIVDFFCYETMLVIEVDGGVHDTSYQKERDLERTEMLKNLGIKEIRFRNEEIFSDIESVIMTIRKHLKQAK